MIGVDLTKLVRVLGVAAAVAVIAFGALFLTVWLGFRGSLPALDGTVPVRGLSAQVVIARDSVGAPTITGASRADLARGLGYLHGQDRFFQMDLMRRAASGELSALLGPGLIDTDRHLRAHRFRRVARAAIASLSSERRTLLDAYVDGVNAGLASLKSRPFEYWLLQTKPDPWRAEDTALCVHAMFLQLQDPEGHVQLQRGLLRATLPESLWRFLEAGAPEWEAAVDGSGRAEPAVPPADAVNLRSQADLPVLPPARVLRQLNGVGSNNWAVAGTRTASGAGLIANDMHLGLRVPTIWYRARLVGEGIDIAGVTLPGAPSIVAGSNGSVAWGFTNSYGEFESVIRLVPVPGQPDHYQTASGPRPLEFAEETIEVKGANPVSLRIASTPWGPVIGKDWEGHPYVLDWTAQDPDAINLDILSLERVRSVEEAVRYAPAFGMPGQNLMLADKAGHIAWIIAGRLPIRTNTQTDVPQLSTDAAPGFSGWVEPANQPRIIDPKDGLLWSANARVVGGAAAAALGDGGMDRGARAAQIHAGLLAAPRPFTPRASLVVQLDDRALFLERWRALLKETIEGQRAAGNHQHEEAGAVLARWSGHAAPGDAAFRLVRLFRAEVEARVYYMLVAPARKAAGDFEFEIPSSFEGPLWRLMRARPMNLLASRYPGWDALLLESLTAAAQLPPQCASLAGCAWGFANTARITHPLSKALPVLASVLDMPPVAVPGGREDMPRVQGPDYGASERFSVSPGHETEGYFHMPGGQSGHPLSPFYRGDFNAWARGLPAPFLPGAALHTLTLVPGP